jgi:fatty acid desaturase
MLRYLISLGFLWALFAIYTVVWLWLMHVWRVVLLLAETALRAGELINGLSQVLRSLPDGQWLLRALATAILFGE